MWIAPMKNFSAKASQRILPLTCFVPAVSAETGTEREAAIRITGVQAGAPHLGVSVQ